MAQLLKMVLIVAVGGVLAGGHDPGTPRCFPDGFLFGTATASAQVEGGWRELGRTPSIWDDFCRAREGVACLNVADDMLHRYKEDLARLQAYGMTSFRFSISWSRVMNWNQSKQQMVRNEPGIQFYHDLIDETLRHGMLPLVTMYHWDLPSELHTRLTPPSWLNAKIQQHFVQYAELLLTEYGAKVKSWSTFNEPWTFTQLGYGSGDHAPGMNNSDVNVYTATHNVLLSHGAAVKRFRELKTEGIVRNDAEISMNLNLDYAYPKDPASESDKAAQRRILDFSVGWFLSPLTTGDYPAIMRERAGSRLPVFTREESEMVKGSYDLFMLNHYASKHITDCSNRSTCDTLHLGWERDLGVETTATLPGARPSSLNSKGKENCPWFSAYPPGYLDTIREVHKYNPSTKILLTENGFCGNSTIENQDQLWYYQNYLSKVHDAIAEGINVIGYTAWSYVDNYEWGSYEPRFGLFYVNFPKDVGSLNETTLELDQGGSVVDGRQPGHDDDKHRYLQRIPRPAAHWYSQVAITRCLQESSRKQVP